jgi:segregation and condensation protein A
MTIEVKLTAFEGPLDLLLHLIQKNKVDIYDIPIADITEQYLEYLEEMRRADLDMMSEFLVMATTLLRIKSQMLLPVEADQKGMEEDPRTELAQRLMEYKMYKYAAGELKDKVIEAKKSFYRMEELPKEVVAYRPPIVPEEIIKEQGITMDQLKEVFEFVMQKKSSRQDPIRSQFREIRQDEVKIEDKIRYIKTRIGSKKEMSFQTLLEAQPSKVELVVTFLALLELMKTGDVYVTQDAVGTDIMIKDTKLEQE